MYENICATKREWMFDKKRKGKKMLIGGHVTRLPMDHKFVTENQLSFNTRQGVFCFLLFSIYEIASLKRTNKLSRVAHWKMFQAVVLPFLCYLRCCAYRRFISQFSSRVIKSCWWISKIIRHLYRCSMLYLIEVIFKNVEGQW